MVTKFNAFNIIILIVFGIFLILGFVSLGLFGFLNRNKIEVGLSTDVVVWGVLPDEIIRPILLSIYKKPDYESLEYFEKEIENFKVDYVDSIAREEAPNLIILETKDLIELQDFLQSIPFSSFTKSDFDIEFYNFDKTDYLVDGGYIGFPLLVDPFVLFYNENLRIQNKVNKLPKTWNELYSLNRVNKNTNTLDQHLIPIGAINNYNNTVDLFKLLLLQLENRGGRPSDNDYTDLFNFFKSFSDTNSIIYSWNEGLRNAEDLFLLGDLLFYPGFASEFNILRQKNPNLVLKVAIIPQIRETRRDVTINKTYGIAITKNNSNAPLSYQTILSILILFQTENEFLLQFIDRVPSSSSFNISSSSPPRWKNFLNSARIGLSFMGASVTDKNIRELIGDLIRNVKTSKEALIFLRGNN